MTSTPWAPHYTFPSNNNLANSLSTGLQSFFEGESDFTGLGPLDPNNSSMIEVKNLITAAQTLTQWWDLNRIGNYHGPGTSQNNPYEVPFDDSQKNHIVSSLGSNADPTPLWQRYHSVTKYISSVGNTYFNLNQDPRYGDVSFQDNKLVIHDVYNFEGIGDWGVRPHAPGMR